MTFHVLILLGSLLLLAKAASWLVRGIAEVSAYLRWHQFVVAFFVMAIGSTLPNLFVGVSSALHGIPELSFADMIGNNVVTLTLVLAAAVFLGGNLVSNSKIVQRATFLTMAIAMLPLLLIIDGTLGRGDALVLIFAFFAYSGWVYSKRNLFTADIAIEEETPVKRFKDFLKGVAFIGAGALLLIVSAEGVVRSATFFTGEFHFPVALFGILVVGLGNALPELYFSVVAARRKENWMVFGELLGSVLVLATLVVGVVALIHPIVISDFAPFALGRAFLIIAALFVLIFIRTARQITKREALVLFLLYVSFVLTMLWCA
ncbi:hypothetical protein KKI17_02215 [Patescibacteria group bacterium]|nr:hypothetical protein [Patescibacteria group bacterium]